MESLYMVINGNSRFYCNKDQIENWINLGCQVYELEPKLLNEDTATQQDDSTDIVISGSNKAPEPEIKEQDA